MPQEEVRGGVTPPTADDVGSALVAVDNAIPNYLTKEFDFTNVVSDEMFWQASTTDPQWVANGMYFTEENLTYIRSFAWSANDREIDPPFVVGTYNVLITLIDGTEIFRGNIEFYMSHGELSPRSGGEWNGVVIPGKDSIIFNVALSETSDITTRWNGGLYYSDETAYISRQNLELVEL